MNAEFETPAAGTTATFEYDRLTVERFREALPNARWDEGKRAWFVPGKTAERRVARWRALEQAKADVHADMKGRDAFEFDPLVSSYLETGLGLIVRTPYSRTVVDELHQVPFARWDGDDKVWRIPFRSYEQLRKRWPAIEAAARRNEPEARKLRAEEAKGTNAFHKSRQRSAERRRRRFPVPAIDLPPPERPVMTSAYGTVTFTETAGELVDEEVVARLYPDIRWDRDLIWARWRSPSLEELVKTWPARLGPTAWEINRGWWMPTKLELVEARKAAKSRERRANAK